MQRESTGRKRRETNATPLSRRKLARGAAGATITAFMIGGIGMDAASAGTYVTRSCDVPGHGYSPMAPWVIPGEVYPEIEVTDACATGEGVRFVVAGQLGGGGGASIRLNRPDTGPHSQIRIIKAVLWYAARLAGSGQPLFFGSQELHTDGTNHPGISNDPPGSENLVAEQLFSPDTKVYSVGIACGPDGVISPEPCVPAAGVPLLIRGMEVTLSEDIQPVVAQPVGTVLTSGAQSGVRTLSYAALDPHSGLARVDVLLDDTVVASRDLTPQCFYNGFTVCPAASDGTLDIDTRAVSNGSHRMALRVRDAAGNERLVTVPGVIDVANQTVGAATRPPAESLLARFAGTSRSTLTVPYRRRASVRGRLIGARSLAPGGAEIEVLERTARGGARERVAGRFHTKADGSFSYRLRAPGPSRAVRLAYRYAGGAVVSQALRLRVRASASLRASLRGGVIRFSGRVQSGPMPKNGKRVRMEGRAPGSAWTSFAQLRTRRGGQFSGTYRLRVRRPGVKLKIRASVLAEAGYPYASSRSKAVTLRVR